MNVRAQKRSLKFLRSRMQIFRSVSVCVCVKNLQKCSGSIKREKHQKNGQIQLIRHVIINNKII